MSSRTLVLALNGPRRRDTGEIQLHRTKAAAHLAQTGNHPLLIVGDANDGHDLRCHAEVARAVHGIVHTAHHPDGRTISDIWAAIAFLKRLQEGDEFYGRIGEIRLVTDRWHLERALAMLEGEFQRSYGPDHGFLFTPHPVDGGELPTHEMVQGEEMGRLAYLAGTYGPSPFPPVGKPIVHAHLHLPSPSRDEDQRPAISGS